MQQPAITPQQEAIQQVRARYEHGDISFDRFEYAINALLQAQTPAECQAIVQELPASPVTALDRPNAPSAPALPNAPRQVRMLNIIGELKRTRRPWKLGQHTTVIMGLGALELDLSLAAIPPEALLEVSTLIGEAKIYVPRSVRVTVRQFTLIGESKALGEERNGIFALLHEEEFPAEGPDAASAPHLTIHMRMLIGSSKVIYTGGERNLLSRVGARLGGLGINVLSGLGVNLRGIDLSGLNLKGADLSGKNLEGAKLMGSNLQDANLSGANLSQVNLMGTNLADADLHGANLSQANLKGANLKDADLGDADLSRARLDGANLRGANVRGAILDGASLRGSNLDQAILLDTQSAPPLLPDSAHSESV